MFHCLIFYFFRKDQMKKDRIWEFSKHNICGITKELLTRLDFLGEKQRKNTTYEGHWQLSLVR